MRLWHLFVTLTLSSTALFGAATEARLVLPVQTAKAGETITVGLELKMAPKWHTYWQNPGDSGQATAIDWKLPPGITAGAIEWPVPEKISTEGIITYVYHDRVLLLVPLSLASNLSPGPVTLAGDASWLECAESCVPGDGKVSASLTIAAESTPSPEAPLIESWRSKLPRSAPPVPVQARWDESTSSNSTKVVIEWPKHDDAVAGDFFPYVLEGSEMGQVTEFRSPSPERIALGKLVKKTEGNWPERIKGLLVETNSAGQFLAAYETELVLPRMEMVAAAGTAVSGPKSSLWVMLGAAFLGGLILNVMPCVLPVIALKVLGFVNQSKEEPARVRQLGVIYMLGVLASFLVLAGIVVGVQLAGRQASWGMQFQNPIFLIAMIVLVLLVALNLFGVFEVMLGGSVMDAAGNLAQREGKSGAFFNGVLATALATPCTAPFLTFALGFAFTQKSAPVIVIVFLAIGFGLSLPYLLLSWWPTLHRFLPKPGVWMEKFKIAMGFPMVATAIWLFSILSRHYGQRGVLWIGLFLTMVSCAAWVWGEFVQRGRQRKALAMVTSVGLLVCAYSVILEGQLHWRKPPTKVASGDDLSSGGIAWKPWSPAAISQAREQGHPVFVDFTADWCQTCKANKATSIEIQSVRDKLKAVDAVALIGDYTLEDDAITQELLKHGRAGVPLVLVYPRNPTAPPIVLPTVLSPGIVLKALEEAVR